MQNTIEKLEDECGRLPDLYFRKFRLLERMQVERPQYPFATNVRLGTNKPVFIQHTLWDKVLKEIYWRATDFKEEKKAKMAQAFHLAKKMKKHMSKKFLVRDELHFYHKLLCIQLSKELDDTFTQIKSQKDDILIARQYIPPHELKEIRQREIEERQLKEIEQAEQKRLEDEKLEQDKFVDQFFNEDDEDMQEQQPICDVNKSPLRLQNGHDKTGRKDIEEELKLDDNGSGSQTKRYKPIAIFMKKMMELNADSFDTPELIAMQEYRDFERKKDILDKLKDTIIKYGGKRKERPSIDNIFNLIYPQPLPQQQQQQLVQEQQNINNQAIEQEKPIKNEQLQPFIQQDQFLIEKKEDEQQKLVKDNQEQQKVQSSVAEPAFVNDKMIAKAFDLVDQEDQMKEEQEEIDYFGSSGQKAQEQSPMFFEKKEENQFNNNESDFLNDNNQNNLEQEKSVDYFDVLASDEAEEDKQEELVNNYFGDVKVEDNPKDSQEEGEDPLPLKNTQQILESANQQTGGEQEIIVEDKQQYAPVKEQSIKSTDEKQDENPDIEIQIVNEEGQSDKADNQQIISLEKIVSLQNIEDDQATLQKEIKDNESHKSQDINEVKQEFLNNSEQVAQENQEQTAINKEQLIENNQEQTAENNQENVEDTNNNKEQIENNLEVSENKEQTEQEEKQIISIEIEIDQQQQQNAEEKLEQEDNSKQVIAKNEEVEQQLMEVEQTPLKIENLDEDISIAEPQKIEDELNGSVLQPATQILSETDKIKQQIKNVLHQQYQQFDQSVCSIMQVEVSKKRKKKDDNQKDTLNEEFLNHIKSLNPQIDPKKMKYENLNELLMFNYNKNQLAQEFDKIFEKTINNYLDFPREFSQIPRVQEVDEDEIEMKGQDLYDLPYETFCYTHGLDMDKFLKKVHCYLSCIVNQEKISKSGIPQKDLFYIDELFKTYPIARKDNNLFAIYTQLDNKNQQTCARVFNESFINSNDKYRVVSLISKQPIFFFFFEYYQGIWGNKHHLIANSLNSNPITKHYQFNNKIVEKLDWTLKIKKKEKFAYLSETILPTMYMFKGDNAKVNDAFYHFVDEKKKKEDMEYNDVNNMLKDEFDFEEAVNRRENSGVTSFTKPQQQIYKNMNKCFANYFSQNRLYDVSNKLEYRKSIIEYARQVKNQTTKFNFDNRGGGEDDKGKTIDYSSFTKMIKVEEVKAQLNSLRNLSNRPLSRKKVIIEANNELYIILNNLKNAVPQSVSQPQPSHGQVGEMMPPQGGPYRGPPPPHNPHMRGPMPPMMNRQNSNMSHGMYPQYPSGSLPPNAQQHMGAQRSHSGYNEPPNGVVQGQGPPPPPHIAHHNPNMQPGNASGPPPQNSQNQQNMMHHRQGPPIPPPSHGMNSNQHISERGQNGVPPGNHPSQLHNGQGGPPPPYGGQPGGSHINNPHHNHHSMQGHQNSSGSLQNTPGTHPIMHNQPPPHQQMNGPAGMHHHPPGTNLTSNGQQHMDKQANMPMGGHPNGGIQSHLQPPPYNQGPPHGHGYPPQGNIQGGPHQQAQLSSGPLGNNQGMPQMKQMHPHPNYPVQGHPNMNNHIQQQGMGPGPLPPTNNNNNQIPNHPSSSNSQPNPNAHPAQQNHEPMPINKKIKKGDNNSPKKPPKKASIQVNPPSVSENISEKGSPKKKKATKKKKGQDDNPASQSQLSNQ